MFNMIFKRTIKLSKNDEQLIAALQLVGDKTRFRLIKLLLKNKGLCVSEIANKLGISIPAASQHFKKFEMAGIVESQRSGQKTCYILRDTALVNKIDRLINEK